MTTSYKLQRLMHRVVCLSVLCAVSGCGGGRKSAYPSDSDQEAISFFQSHKTEFERLRVLIEQTPFMLLNAERKEAIPPDALLRSPEVKTEMLQLMSNLRLKWINGLQSDWGIRLTFLSSGMAMGGTTKSFFYSKQKPKNIVPSTEGFTPNTTDSSSVFRPIESDWYLQFEWGG